MERLSRIAGLGLLAASVAASAAPAQQSEQTPGGRPMAQPAANPLDQPIPQPASTSRTRDLDLLRRDGFAVARRATVTVRISDKTRATPAGLKPGDFTLIVNNTIREKRVHAPGTAEDMPPPMVLLVFPPNDPIVHSIGVSRARQYFAVQPTELLPWKVGIFDANGKLTPFTNGRSQLLANLDIVDRTIEPFQYTTDLGLPRSFHWDGSWLTKAEDAISMMQSFDGPKVLLAMNPLAESIYGENARIFASNGPASLVQVAEHIGAHIYIANVGGPDVLVPGGDASEGTRPNTLRAPSYRNRMDFRQVEALNYFAFRNSQMMQTAEETMGGFSNSLKDLAAMIHRDLDDNYTLEFDMTPQDRDHGVPKVEVRLANHDLKLAILELTPIGSNLDTVRDKVSKELLEAMNVATRQHVTSPQFRITQHVDYFPVRGGLEPVLPMSGLVEWTGGGRGPERVAILESVEDLTLSTTILERQISASWDGHSLSWERDGRLRPGNYIWRVAIHDGRGKIFSTAEQKIAVGMPRTGNIAASSLILGRSCREEDDVAAGLRRRVTPDQDEQGRLMMDPMKAVNCRVKPEPASSFAPQDILHAFVRLYPGEKLHRSAAETWTAKFVLRSGAGALEAERETPFTVDSGSGYLASIDLPLGTPAVTSGPHTMVVEMRGPGIHGELRETRTISIVPPK